MRYHDGMSPREIEVVQIRSARDAIATLRPSGERWLLEQPGDWVFRGHAVAEWPLRAKAVRAGSLSRYLGPLCMEETTVPGASPLEAQLHNELRAVEEFVTLANEVGLGIPSDSAHVWMAGLKADHIHAGMHDPLAPWPPVELVPIFALAQHHGVPTRLLDFTRHPLVALFFAARDPVQASTEGNMAVWAINANTLVNAGPWSGADHFAVINTGGFANDFLRAQRGVFIHHLRMNRWRKAEGCWPSLDEALLRYEYAKPVGVKFEIPRSESAEILRLLSYENVTVAHIMPTYDNVVNAIQELRKLGLHKWLT